MAKAPASWRGEYRNSSEGQWFRCAPVPAREVAGWPGKPLEQRIAGLRPSSWPERSQRQNWSAAQAQEVFDSRLGLVMRQLARSPYLAGENFTAADISVTYALQLAQRAGGVTLGEAERAYMGRTSGREAYKRAMETCKSIKAWAAKAAAAQAAGQ